MLESCFGPEKPRLSFLLLPFILYCHSHTGIWRVNKHKGTVSPCISLSQRNMYKKIAFDTVKHGEDLKNIIEGVWIAIWKCQCYSIWFRFNGILITNLASLVWRIIPWFQNLYGNAKLFFFLKNNKNWRLRLPEFHIYSKNRTVKRARCWCKGSLQINGRE